MTYLDYVRSLDCSLCGAPAPSESHHAIDLGLGGYMGGTASDLHTMPVCHPCHMRIHNEGLAETQRDAILRTQAKAIKEGIMKK